MRTLPSVIIATVLLLAGCASSTVEEEQEETLRAMNAEMPDEDRVAICDGYEFDPDTTYFAFVSRWNSLLVLQPPDRGAFNLWMERDVCVGPIV